MADKTAICTDNNWLKECLEVPKSVSRNAKDGNIKGLDSALSLSQRCEQECGIPDLYAEEDERAKLYREAYSSVLQRARKFADSGLVMLMKRKIGEARVAAEKGGMVIDESELKEIQMKGYVVDYHEDLYDAARAARNGNVGKMNQWIEAARKSAAEAGLTVDEKQVKALEKRGYENGCKKELKKARQVLAHRPILTDIRAAEEALQMAYEYAREIGIERLADSDIRAKIKEGYKAEYDRTMAFVDALMSNGTDGYPSLVLNQYLGELREYAPPAGIKVDEAKIDLLEFKGHVASVGYYVRSMGRTLANRKCFSGLDASGALMEANSSGFSLLEYLTVKIKRANEI